MTEKCGFEGFRGGQKIGTIKYIKLKKGCMIEISTKLVSNLHWGIFDLILVQLKAFLESAPPLTPHLPKVPD